MSFFTEIHNDTIILFSKYPDNEPYKRPLNKMGGVFYAAVEASDNEKYPAWIFDINKKDDIESFVYEQEERESVNSLPDIELLFDEIFRRIEKLETTMEYIMRLLPEEKS